MKIILDKEQFISLSSKYGLGTLQKISGCKKVIYYSYLFSKDSFLRRFNNMIEKVEIIDGDKQLINYGDIELLGDNSTIHYKPFDGLQYPTNLTEIHIAHHMYKLQKQSAITLHIQKMNTGVINDIWFEIDNEFIGNQFVMEDIDTFLKC